MLEQTVPGLATGLGLIGVCPGHVRLLRIHQYQYHIQCTVPLLYVAHLKYGVHWPNKYAIARMYCFGVFRVKYDVSHAMAGYFGLTDTCIHRHTAPCHDITSTQQLAIYSCVYW